MLPSEPGIASPECSRGRIRLSISAGAHNPLSCLTGHLLSRPDLALPEPRRATQGMGGAEPPGATRSAIFIGGTGKTHLDVSQKLTAICVVDDTGRRLWRGQ